MISGDRMLAYFGGFVLGMLLVSFIMLRREAKESAEADPWQDHNIAMLEAGAEPLPESVPDSLKGGQILDFGFLPDRDNAGQHVEN